MIKLTAFKVIIVITVVAASQPSMRQRLSIPRLLEERETHGGAGVSVDVRLFTPWVPFIVHF